MIQQAMLSSLQGQPNFSNIIKALEGAVQGNYSAFVGDQQAPTVESVVGLPLECGDGGNYNPKVSFRIDLMAFQSTVQPNIRISKNLWK